MGQSFDGAFSVTPHYYVVQGRAAEIALAHGSAVADAEHLFLGMLHDGGWPVDTISHLVDLGAAEQAVLAILGSPGYTPPAAPLVPVPRSHVRSWGVMAAREIGDSYLGLEHALLAMIRARDSVPARALAGLADLDALEAALLAAKNAPVGPSESSVFLPEGQQMDGPLSKAIMNALPEGSTFGFNTADGRTWMDVIGPGVSVDQAVTREVLNAALASLGRPGLDA